MYPFDSQGKTENYRSCPSTSLRQRRAAPSRDLTVTTVIFYYVTVRRNPNVDEPPRTRGEGAAGAAAGARGCSFFYVNHFCIFLVVTKKKGFNFIINV